MEALGLNVIDWFIIVVLTASGLISLSRGFTKELLSLFLWVMAFIAAITLGYMVTPKINEFIGNSEVSKILSYISIFLVSIVLGGFLIKFISKLIKWSGASGVDRFLGVLFGLLRGLVVLFVIFILLPSSVKNTSFINESKIAPYIEKYAPAIETFFNRVIDKKEIMNDAIEDIKPINETIKEVEDVYSNNKDS